MRSFSGIISFPKPPTVRRKIYISCERVIWLRMRPSFLRAGRCLARNDSDFCKSLNEGSSTSFKKLETSVRELYFLRGRNTLQIKRLSVTSRACRTRSGAVKGGGGDWWRLWVNRGGGLFKTSNPAWWGEAQVISPPRLQKMPALAWGCKYWPNSTHPRLRAWHLHRRWGSKKESAQFTNAARQMNTAQIKSQTDYISQRRACNFRGRINFHLHDGKCDSSE